MYFKAKDVFFLLRMLFMSFPILLSLLVIVLHDANVWMVHFLAKLN